MRDFHWMGIQYISAETDDPAAFGAEQVQVAA
jgi:hypothetical protein